MSAAKSPSRSRIITGGVLLTLLLAAVFTLGSLGVPFEPRNWREIFVLFLASTFLTAALLVFGLILTRNVLRLWAERSKQQLGARFKTKMVIGAVAISLLPVLFMFFVSYSLLNRTLARWFPRPLELAASESRGMLLDFGKMQLLRLNELRDEITSGAAHSNSANPAELGQNWTVRAASLGADSAWLVHQNGEISGLVRRGSGVKETSPAAIFAPRRARSLPSGADVWLLGEEPYIASRPSAFPSGPNLVVARRLPADFLRRFEVVEEQMQAYEQEKQHLRALKTQLLLILLLFTVLLLFSVLWVALFLAKQVTVPIQALAEGTREVSAGNFSYQVPEQAQDELGVLVRSFNLMTTQLRDSRQQIDEFTRNLQQAVQELERRRQLMETVLDNIPTGVVPLDEEGRVRRANPAVVKIIGETASQANSLEQLLGDDAGRQVRNLMRRALRMGVVTREIELVVQGRVLHAAVTVSAFGPTRANSGYVVVLDDLTEVLRAQKSAAWQEVARRIAHEIKNPLTPIQLSAQRLIRFLEQQSGKSHSGETPASQDGFTQMVQECARLIEREVATLATLVGEFTQFVRFPAAKLVPTDANRVLREALEVFGDRLDGITLTVKLDPNLPLIRGDGALLRSVLVNLIDNAAEALEDSRRKEIHVHTLSHTETDLVEICVSDTGPGISPHDKDRLFLPTFSTKDRGTGLGLAIAARIIAEHNGSIRVEDNRPSGARFFVELPALEHAVAHSQEPA